MAHDDSLVLVRHDWLLATENPQLARLAVLQMLDEHPSGRVTLGVGTDGRQLLSVRCHALGGVPVRLVYDRETDHRVSGVLDTVLRVALVEQTEDSAEPCLPITHVVTRERVDLSRSDLAGVSEVDHGCRERRVMAQLRLVMANGLLQAVAFLQGVEAI